MPAQSTFDYAVIRVVPQVEREEFLNVGVIVFCRTRRFLDCRIDLNATRLQALAPTVDVESVQEHLDIFARICAGGPGAGPIGGEAPPERFRWLTSPYSTTIQTSAVHCGLCVDPQVVLDELFEKLVKRP